MQRYIQLVLLLIGCLTPRVQAAEPIDFNRDIRPILANTCFACHGPDVGERQAGLRLDTPQGALSLIHI